MITPSNIPSNLTSYDHDFTRESYKKLVKTASASYRIASYSKIPWTEDFLLWRHDIDISLNSALKLAEIENQEDLRATYFINPHSEFYNLAEAGQHQITKKILSLGHDLGLHFDAAFYGIESEEELDRLITKESLYLKDLFGVKPTAFSFHNPLATHLNCDADEYGGLVNCYSKRFKEEVAYCSDSNGYWRFRRLPNVLSEKKNARLQVLTHPGWWQNEPMPPRQRIFRSAYGRAAATMRMYDQGLEDHGRLNHAGSACTLLVLKNSLPQQYELCDLLWNQEAFQALFVELWRLHEAQIDQLCKAQLRKVWSIPATEVNTLFATDGIAVDGWQLFETLFETKWQAATGITEAAHKDWIKIRNQLAHARSSTSPTEFEQGCVHLCQVIQQLAAWGLSQPLAYDGLAHLGSISLQTNKTTGENLTEHLVSLPHHILKRWQDFLTKLSNLTQD